MKTIKISEQKQFKRFLSPVAVAAAVSFAGTTGIQDARAGGYVFAGETNGVDIITHPTGYTGVGGTLDVRVCIDPTSVNSADMARSVQNIVSTFNKLKPTTGNSRIGAVAGVDFESVALHEIGHCIGMSHPNLGSQTGVSGNNTNYTYSTNGADNTFGFGSGTDGIIGSADDIRGDDINLFWYRTSNNNPFSIASVVDSTTYARNTASLPNGSLFAVNPDRAVADSIVNATIANLDTEGVMQQGSIFNETQRTLGHDDVATLELAKSGLDEIAGNGDDYEINLIYGGITTDNCDLTLDFDNSQTGFAVCQTGGNFVSGDHLRITSANMFFNDGFNWVFNNNQSCSATASAALVANEWNMISLPCQPGISDDGTVATILGDDLTGTIGTDWKVFKRVHGGAANYEEMAATDTMEEGVGYWVRTTQSGDTLDMQGEYNSQPDVSLTGDNTDGEFNMVGNSFRVAVNWSDVYYVDAAGDELTLAEADPVVGANNACSSNPVDTGCVASRTMYKWNGTAYQSFDGNSGTGTDTTIDPFEAFWVEAFADNTAIRVPMPAGELTASSAEVVSVASSNELVASSQARTSANRATRNRAKRSGDNWFVRLTASSGSHSDPGNTFGVIPTSVNGPDAHDLKELTPFGSDHLTVVFPHPEWGEFAGDYTTDFRDPGQRGHRWAFEVRSGSSDREITLSWDGPAWVLRKSVIIDTETGQRYKAKNSAFTFTMDDTSKRFEWRLNGFKRLSSNY